MRLLLAIVVGVTCNAAFGQVRPRTFRRASIGLDSLSGSTEPSSNSAYPIISANGIVYLGTDKGLDVTTDGGRTFRSQWGSDGPIGASVSAIAVEGDTIAVAVGAGEIVQDGVPIDIGGGLYASVNAGATWTYEPQSRDSTNDTAVVFGKNVLRALPVTTDVANISYSLAFHKGYLYAADWAGGLRRTSDLGKAWQRMVLPPDYLDYITEDSTYSFQLSPVAGNLTTETNYSQSGFSLYSDGDSVLYLGTAGGIEKTTDNGYSWHKFSHQSDHGLSGDWVVWITGQNYGTAHRIWATTLNANDATEVRALSYSTDCGASWHYILPGHSFHSVATIGETVYGASDDGLLVTSDFGLTSQVITNISDPKSGYSILSQSFAAVASTGDSIWVGTADGTAVGIDNGSGFGPQYWHVFRTSVSLPNASSTYFFPNPFSPRLDVGRIDYSVKSPGSIVTIRVYDFSMHVVKTILQNATRGQGEVRERWDGLDNQGQMVDNGVYFYSVVVNNGDPVWGKIMVVR